MDTLEKFLTDFLLKTLQHSFPNLTPDDQAKIQKSVTDAVTAAMDIAQLYFALRTKK